MLTWLCSSYAAVTSARDLVIFKGSADECVSARVWVCVHIYTYIQIWNLLHVAIILTSVMALAHPFTSVCVGSTGTGKTQFVLKLIENIDRMISPGIDEIIWGYNQWQDSYNELIINKFNFIKVYRNWKSLLKTDYWLLTIKWTVPMLSVLFSPENRIIKLFQWFISCKIYFTPTKTCAQFIWIVTIWYYLNVREIWVLLVF